MGISPRKQQEYTRFRTKKHLLEFRQKYHSLDGKGERKSFFAQRDPLAVPRAFDYHQESSLEPGVEVPASDVAGAIVGSVASGSESFSGSGNGSETVSAEGAD